MLLLPFIAHIQKLNMFKKADCWLFTELSSISSIISPSPIHPEYELSAFRNKRWLNTSSDDLKAISCFYSKVVLIEPTVSSLFKKNEISPIIIDFTGHIGYHNSGWKSDMVRHIFL